MTQTYKQIQKQIEQLQRRAEALRNAEVKGVIDRIKVAIAHYGLTAAHLGLGSGPSARPAAKRATGARGAKAKGRRGAQAQFGDGNGNVWSGRGPRPHWLRDALAAGGSLDQFRLAGAAEAAAPAKPAARKSKRAPSKMLYRDDAGNSWGGRGPKPKWLKAALESGKSLQDFAG
jgi:DNA-binding protein H-NS